MPLSRIKPTIKAEKSPANITTIPPVKTAPKSSLDILAMSESIVAMSVVAELVKSYGCKEDINVKDEDFQMKFSMAFAKIVRPKLASAIKEKSGTEGPMGPDGPMDFPGDRVKRMQMVMSVAAELIKAYGCKEDINITDEVFKMKFMKALDNAIKAEMARAKMALRVNAS